MNTDMNLTNRSVEEKFLAIMAKGGIRGADGEGGDPPSDPPTPPANPPTGGLTQDQVDAIVGQRVGQAKRTALKEWAEGQGMTAEEVQDILKAHKDRQASETTELQKAQTKASEEGTKRQQAESALAREQLSRAIDVELVLAGIKKTELPRIRNLVTLEIGATEDEITAEIESLKATYPALFNSEGTPPPPATPPANLPPSDPGAPPRTPAPPADAQAQAKALLASRHPRAVQS